MTREEAAAVVRLSEVQLRVEVMNNIDSYLTTLETTLEEIEAIQVFIKRPIMQTAGRLKHLAQELADSGE